MLEIRGVRSKRKKLHMYMWKEKRRGFFFFQAEDGIRDDLVTGVQTCALPIFLIYVKLNKSGSALVPNYLLCKFFEPIESQIKPYLVQQCLCLTAKNVLIGFSFPLYSFMYNDSKSKSVLFMCMHCVC